MIYCIKNCKNLLSVGHVLIVFLLFFNNNSVAKDHLYSISEDSSEIILVGFDAPKYVFVPHESIGNSWREYVRFNDSSWGFTEGMPGGIGYEKNSGYEEFISFDVGSEMYFGDVNSNLSCYLRIPFQLDSAALSKIHALQLNIRYDDGFKAYLNGTLIAQANAPYIEVWNSKSTAGHEANDVSIINISTYISTLVSGQNLLAIQGMNDNNRSSDFLITTEMVANMVDPDSTNLPIIHVFTGGQKIVDETKIAATMQIIDKGKGKKNHPDGTPTDYDGNIGIKIRGTWSATFPLKGYKIETRDSQGENLDVSLLGIPEENDWALITNYNEKTFIRNILSFDLFREMGHYATRACLCELYIDKVFQGIYVFSENIKRDKNRVDISKLNPDENSGDDLTGGYIIKIDYHDETNSWPSNFSPVENPTGKVYFVYHYPDEKDISNEQKTYIQDFINKLQTALFGEDFADPVDGYRKYMDVDSFIDYLILNEAARNGDGFKKSRYFYKDKDSQGCLLHAGPVWDFDYGWKTLSTSSEIPTEVPGWRHTKVNAEITSPGWYTRLMQDGYFTNKLIDRYFQLRATILDLDKIYKYIDSVVNYIGTAQKRHFALWPIDQGFIAKEPGPPPKSYEEQISRFKNWIKLRFEWIDANIRDLSNNIITNAAMKQVNGYVPSKFMLDTYPNPFNPVTHIKYGIPSQKGDVGVVIKVFDVRGCLVATLVNDRRSVGIHEVEFNASNLASGIYLIHFQCGAKILLQKIVLIK